MKRPKLHAFINTYEKLAQILINKKQEEWGNKQVRAILKGKWFILAAWIVVIAALFMVAPNMEALVREKGQITVPEGYSSTIAEKILKDVQSSENSGK